MSRILPFISAPAMGLFWLAGCQSPAGSKLACRASVALEVIDRGESYGIDVMMVNTGGRTLLQHSVSFDAEFTDGTSEDRAASRALNLPPGATEGIGLHINPPEETGYGPWVSTKGKRPQKPYYPLAPREPVFSSRGPGRFSGYVSASMRRLNCQCRRGGNAGGDHPSAMLPSALDWSHKKGSVHVEVHPAGVLQSETRAPKQRP
jgi:hypothetical protein